MRTIAFVFTALAPFALVSATYSIRHEGLNETVTTRRLDDSYVYVACGVDIVGSDTKNQPDANPDSCAFFMYELNQGATWTNYNGGTCWLKSPHNMLPDAVPNAGAVSFLRISSNWDVSYFIGKLDVDMPGYDIASTSGEYHSCLDSCMRNPKCFAFTWTDYNGGTCWLKSRANAYVPKQGAKSVFVLRQATSLGMCKPL